MKIAVCTLHINDWYTEIVKYGLQTIRNYAKQHGYDFYTDNDVYDGERPLPWYKIKAVQRRLKDYDIIMWIDVDGHILKPHLTIEDHFLKLLPEGFDILCSKDHNNPLNTGLMIFRNTPFVHTILEKTWNNDPENFKANFHEQASLGYLYKENIENSKSHIKVLPLWKRHLLWSYWCDYTPNCTFFIHIARCANDRFGFTFTMDCYCPLKMEEETEASYKYRMKWMNTLDMCRKDIKKWKNKSGGYNIPTRVTKGTFTTDNEKNFLIVGHPKGGLIYIRHLLSQYGLRIGLGKMRKDGISSWYYGCMDSVPKYSEFLPRNSFKFDVVIQCVRDPLYAIPSIYFTATPFEIPKYSCWLEVIKTSYNFRMKVLGIKDSNIFNCVVKSFLGWHNLIDKNGADLVVKVEDTISLEEYLKSQKLKRLWEDSLDFNSQKRIYEGKEFPWKKVDKDLIKELDKWAVKYGYSKVSSRLKLKSVSK